MLFARRTALLSTRPYRKTAANHPWIDWDRTLIQHVRADPLPQVGALGGVSSEDDRPTVKQRRSGVTRHVDDATKDAWHPYKLEPQGDPHMTIVGARTDGLTGVRWPFLN